jgi:hypothetical protein
MPRGGLGRNEVRQKQPEDLEAAQSEAETAQKNHEETQAQSSSRPEATQRHLRQLMFSNF